MPALECLPHPIKLHPVLRLVQNWGSGMLWADQSPVYRYFARVGACVDAWGLETTAKNQAGLRPESDRLLGPRLFQPGLPGVLRRLASFRKHTASQSAATLLFGAAVRWLICQSLFCCLYWLLPLSVRAVGRTFTYSLSVQALVVWESGGGAAVDWSQGETSDLFLLARPSRDDDDW